MWSAWEEKVFKGVTLHYITQYTVHSTVQYSTVLYCVQNDLLSVEQDQDNVFCVACYKVAATNRAHLSIVCLSVCLSKKIY